MLCVLFFCVFLWEIECSHCMIQHTNNTLGSFFSHRAHRVHWAFWRTFRAHRTPSAYRVHRALLPMKIPIRRQKAAYIHLTWVSRWLLPFPSGEGSGEGPAGDGGGATIFLNPVCSVHLCKSVREKIILCEGEDCPLWEKEMSFVRDGKLTM